MFHVPLRVAVSALAVMGATSEQPLMPVGLARWTGTADSLRLAIQDLVETFGPAYPGGRRYLKRLEALKQRGGPDDREIQALAREALLANPLLDSLRLVFVKRPSFRGHDGFFAYTSYVRRSPAELCVLESVRHGRPVRTLLRAETGCIRDPDVSFDGRKVLFAYAEGPQSNYLLHEINSDGTGLRRLTEPPPYRGPEPPYNGRTWDDIEPCYLPNGDIVFASTRYVRFVDCVDVEPVTTLFLMGGNGKNLRGISANHVHDLHPSVLGDGRVVYTRWEYTDRSQMWPHKLFVKNPDGSATAAFYGSNSWWPVSMLHARAVRGSNRVLCTLAGHHSDTEQSGEIALLDPARGTEETRGIVALFPPRKIEPIYRDDPRPSAEVRYTEPFPLSEKHFIVSFSGSKARGNGKSRDRFALYLADFFGNRLLLYEDGSLDCLSAMPLSARPLPPVIPPRADYRQRDVTMVLIDVYQGAGMAGVPRGTIKSLRVMDFDVRDTPRTGGLRQEETVSGGHSCPVTALGGSWHVKRILGTVPVHPDGSAAFRIPAERRVFFQALDEHGRAVQTMRSWVEAMPGERMTCVGCHESRLAAPPARHAVMALAKEPVRPSPWYGPPRAFGFAREVQPVLDRHCVRCHDATDPKGIDLRGDATSWFSLAYENLRPFVNPVGPQSMPMLLPPRSRGAAASRLVDMLLAGHQDARLAAEDLDRIITWIDLNVPYYDNTAITRPSRVALANNVTGSGRAVVSDAGPLWRSLGDRCRDCHPRGFRVDPISAPCMTLDLPKAMTRPCVNLTHPAESRLLTAPLAKSAGGLGLCRKPVFANRDDPGYRAALKVIQGWHDELTVRPREDMPGFEPCAAYKDTQSKRQAWLVIEAENRQNLASP